MPYKTTWKPNGIFWQFYGYVTAKEILQANTEFYSDERSDNTHFQLIDTRQVDDIEWNELKIKEIAAQDKGASLFLPKMKVAYIYRKPEIQQVLVKYIAISRLLNSNWEFQGFSDLEQALSWVKQTDFCQKPSRT